MKCFHHAVSFSNRNNQKDEHLGSIKAKAFILRKGINLMEVKENPLRPRQPEPRAQDVKDSESWQPCTLARPLEQYAFSFFQPKGIRGPDFCMFLKLRLNYASK